jgi:hypothetical protein
MSAAVIPLYQRTEDLAAVREWILEHEDEIRAMEGALPDELAELLTQAEGDFKTKAESVALMVRELEGLAKFAGDERKRLEAREAHYKKAAAGLKDYLRFHMLSSGVEKIEGKLCNVALQNSPPSLVVNAEVWTQEALAEVYEAETHDELRTVRLVPAHDEFEARRVIERGTVNVPDPANPRKLKKQYQSPAEGLEIKQDKHIRIR